MWHGLIITSVIISVKIPFNSGVQFQSFSGVDLEFTIGPINLRHNCGSHYFMSPKIPGLARKFGCTAISLIDRRKIAVEPHKPKTAQA